MAKWHSCVITKLHGIIEAVPRFMDWVSDERRKGDIDNKYAITARCIKNHR